MTSLTTINLVADIGGTNIRIGVTDINGNIDSLSVYQCNLYPSLSAVIRDYLVAHKFEQCAIHACLAIACPVENDLIVMTNLPWEFSKSQLQQELNLKTLLLINDYTAIAHAIPLLSGDQKVQVGQGSAVTGKPISICGPGTGLGVANLVSDNGKWISLSGEGGHVDFAPIDHIEQDLLRFLLTKYSHVSYEQLLSGLGIEQIYQGIAWTRQLDAPLLTAQEISTKALNNECELCSDALSQFCKILGSFAGNLALTLGSFGGVYIAGGIVPRFIEYFNNSEFRKRFEEKGRLSGFNQHIPTYVITESQPGILGAAAYLLQFNKEAL